ncbi:MFS transporter [Xanthomonas oryzae pv. oryzicola]|uniref:MFS transporter n=1 Tax=Xanthomonas oryzae TaxID=347 RepID=UPI0003FE4EE5|nr:MFS transporter [Xanthomonas oryzae]AKO04447.1 hypothetical protein ACU16_10135 [Xanthomonas oryzae pv. oryzicola]AKO08336.1 hypothetical protein ACU17_09990 [Xanthomonas oryzae pv. oryzicola]OWB23094.1 MFS transporter [Xanthomonas oryzae pv. oryzicola]
MSIPPPSSAQAVGYLALVKDNRNFRKIWLADIASGFGDWFTIIASASLIGALGSSATGLGILFILRTLPPFLISPLAGVLADRLNPRSIMVASDLLRALAVCALVLVDGPEDFWLVYAITALQEAASGFFTTARNTVMPEILSSRELGAGNALSSASYAMMLAVGAGIGGIFAGKFGLIAAFLVDALTYVVSAVLVLAAHAPRQAGQRTPRTSILADYADSLRYLRQQHDIRFLVLQKGLNALLITGSLHVLITTIATQHFPLGQAASLSIGLLYCAAGVGGGIGPLLARVVSIDHTRRLRLGLALSYCISAAGLAVAATMGSFWVVAVGLVIRGAGGGILYMFSSHLLMDILPSELRGRIFGTEHGLRTLLNAVGIAAGSILIEQGLTPRQLLLLMACAALLPFLAWLRRLR